MSDIKKFLRFEISGYVVFLYVILFCVAFFDFNKITIGLAKNVLDLSISGFIIAAPLGFLIHQLDISLFSPFKETRLWKERKAIKVLKGYTKGCHIFKDKKPQVSLEIIKCLSEKENKFNYSYFEKEISNRYSYYYSRWEAGVFAPFFGLIIFLIFSGFLYFNFKNPFIESFSWLRVIFIISIVLIICIISISISSYCGTLLDEIDELECLFLEKNKDLIFMEYGEKNKN